MTIQTVISNRSSMILCTDLRQTVEEYKSYVGVKKIFELNENRPIGIMVNGLMDFEGVPLETLIGEFKQELVEYDDLSKIKHELVSFMEENTPHVSIDEYLSWVLPMFKTRMIELIHEDGFKNVIIQKKKEKIPDFVKQYYYYNDEFHDIIPEDCDENHYNHVIWEIFSYELNFEGTEIIIAGFDKKHHYGSLYSFNIYFNHNGNLIIRDVESIVNCEEAFIRVYAMNEEAYAFITGVSSDFEEYVKRTLKTVNNNIIQNIEWFLKSKQIKNVHEILEILKNELLIGEINLNRHIENFKLDIIQDTSNCCEYLPRQLLCDFADSLIKLTALKQKLSLDLETVSSESDIALITKTGNLKWIKYTEEII